MALVDVVKCEINDQLLVEKYPQTDLRIGSQLVVYPGQTALFVKGGKIYDEFMCGTYTIKSENIPLLGKIINLPFGGETPFKAEVWFVNQVSLLDCKWGTKSPIQIEDPKYGVIVPVRSYGQYGFKISNPKVFLEKFVGNMPSFTKEKLIDYFRGVILSKLTNIISDKLTKDKLSVLNINSYVDGISSFAKERLQPVFASYGVDLEMFHAISVNVDESDPSFVELKNIKARAAEIKILGREDYQMTRSFNVLEKAAENEGGGAMNAAVGIGAGVGIGAQIGNIASQTLNVNPDIVPPIPTTQFYLAIKGKRQGPFDQSTIEKKISDGEIDENTLVWKKPMKSWAALSTIDEFQHLFDEDCPPPIPNV